MRISARLYLPAEGLGFQGPRPLVYYIHGGPQGQDEAIEIWEKALRLEPGNEQLRRYVNQAHEKLKRTQPPEPSERWGRRSHVP